MWRLYGGAATVAMSPAHRVLARRIQEWVWPLKLYSSTSSGTLPTALLPGQAAAQPPSPPVSPSVLCCCLLESAGRQNATHRYTAVPLPATQKHGDLHANNSPYSSPRLDTRRLVDCRLSSCLHNSRTCAHTRDTHTHATCVSTHAKQTLGCSQISSQVTPFGDSRQMLQWQRSWEKNGQEKKGPRRRQPPAHPNRITTAGPQCWSQRPGCSQGWLRPQRRAAAWHQTCCQAHQTGKRQQQGSPCWRRC